MIKKSTFLKLGEKEAISISVIPQYYKTNAEAIAALEKAVLQYQHSCGRSLNRYSERDNPFTILIVHGINL